MEINGQLEVQVALHREKSPWYPLNRKLEGRKDGLDTLGKAQSIAPIGNRVTIQPDIFVPFLKRRSNYLMLSQFIQGLLI